MGNFLNYKIAKRRRRPFFAKKRQIPFVGSFVTTGTAVFRFFKSVFFRILDLFRYNPLAVRIAGVSVLTAFVFGAFFLVLFAVISPELPPGNLISTLDDVAVYYQNSNNSGYQEVVLSFEEDWARQTMYTEFETGAGIEAQDRTVDILYPIRPGETISEIAYAYGISYDFLAWYNKISNANKIRVGTVITIPSLDNIKATEVQYQQQKARQVRTTAETKAVKSIQITCESRVLNGSGVTVHFSIVNPPSDLKSYEWDLGDGKRSFREDPSYEYSISKTYVVRLTAQDGSGSIYRSNPLYIDLPHPGSAAENSIAKFVTLSSPDDYFVVNGTVTRVARYASVESSPLDLSESDQFLTKVRFRKSGFYGVTVREESGKEQYYSIFVSPIPSVHADIAMNDFNWYRTQFNTGTSSNCGPASASMAIGWGIGKYYSVSSVRQTIGWQGEGGTSFEELLGVIKNQGIPASIQPLRSVQNLRDVIDSGAIAIILFYTQGVKTTQADPASSFFGKYYNDSVGHYTVVKGYSLNGDYFIVNDPIPSDWAANGFRYGDEISMMGRNRYYLAAEVLRSLRRPDMIVVPGQ